MKKAVLALMLALYSIASLAGTIGFDDLEASETAPVAAGYGGFDWTGLGVIGFDAYPGSGYANGVVSPANVAFNHRGETVTISKAGGFDFIGAFFTSAWQDQELSFEGSRDGQVVFSTDVSYVIDTLAPQWIALGWRGIDTLVIYNSSGTQWAMDDFTVAAAVPEPGTLALFGVAALGLPALRRRRVPR